MVYYSSINIYNMSSCLPSPVSDPPSYSDSHCTSKQVEHRTYLQLFRLNSSKDILADTENSAFSDLLIIYMFGLLQSLKTNTKADNTSNVNVNRML